MRHECQYKYLCFSILQNCNSKITLLAALAWKTKVCKLHAFLTRPTRLVTGRNSSLSVGLPVISCIVPNACGFPSIPCRSFTLAITREQACINEFYTRLFLRKICRILNEWRIRPKCIFASRAYPANKLYCIFKIV